MGSLGKAQAEGTTEQAKGQQKAVEGSHEDFHLCKKKLLRCCAVNVQYNMIQKLPGVLCAVVVFAVWLCVEKREVEETWSI